MAKLNIKLTDIPTETGRPKLPNPMMEVAQMAVEARAKNKAVIFEPPIGEGEGEYSLDYVERKLRECGADLNVTISVRQGKTEKGEWDGTLTVYAKDRIKRTRRTVTPEQAAELKAKRDAEKTAGDAE